MDYKYIAILLLIILMCLYFYYEIYSLKELIIPMHTKLQNMIEPARADNDSHHYTLTAPQTDDNRRRTLDVNEQPRAEEELQREELQREEQSIEEYNNQPVQTVQKIVNGTLIVVPKEIRPKHTNSSTKNTNSSSKKIPMKDLKEIAKQKGINIAKKRKEDIIKLINIIE